MAGKEIPIAGKDGTFMGYLATPTGSSGPGVIVVQEIFGINPWLRSVVDWLASQGYMALAPDLFWKLSPGIQLDSTKEDEFNKGLELFGKFDVNGGVDDIQATISTLRKMPGCSGKVGNLGFCLGGKFTYLSSVRHAIDAAVSYYGVQIHEHLDEADNLKCPLIMNFAENDPHVPADTVETIRARMGGNDNVQIHIYPGTEHGFNRYGYDPYNEAQAAIARERTLAHFRKHLG